MREAFAAKDGTALRGAEGHGRVLAALGAGGARFDAGVALSVAVAGSVRGSQHCDPFGLAGFATLGLVLKAFVVKKELFPGGEHELRAAVDADQYLILKFH